MASPSSQREKAKLIRAYTKRTTEVSLQLNSSLLQMYFICFKGTQTHRQKPLSSFTSSFPKGNSQEKGQTETGTCEFHLGLSSGWQEVDYRSHDQPPLRAHSSMKLEESPHVNTDVLPWDVSATATSQLLGQMPVPTFFFLNKVLHLQHKL